MCPSTIFKWKYKFYLVILNKKVWNFWNPSLVKITMVNLVFHLKSVEGHMERFSFDVYMPSITIFIKIKQPFALHKNFLVRRLRKYSDNHSYFSFQGKTHEWFYFWVFPFGSFIFRTNFSNKDQKGFLGFIRHTLSLVTLEITAYLRFE